ncbi:excisionase family DNA-binding protein [Saliterribacillus persicus]|nr:excisionase family DNA-binding protein [Saliterribacillus persicus]
MYLSMKETANYLEMDQSIIRKLVLEQKIRAIYDGEDYLINKDQFNDHLKQIELYKERIREYLQEPIPEDIDVKDED